LDSANNFSEAIKLNKDIFDKYHMNKYPNDYKYFHKISEILRRTSDGSNDTPEYIFGISREYDEYKNGNFNMFIDFAYATSFNFYDIPLFCATQKAEKFLSDINILDQSYRAFALSISFKKRKESENDQKYWGDDKSTKYRLHKHKRKNYNIFDSNQLLEVKKDFEKNIDERDPLINLLNDGHFGISSQFNLLVHRLSHIIQPQINLNYAALDKDSKIEYQESSISGNSKLIKSKNGHLNLNLSVKGCLDKFEIWTETGTKLEIDETKIYQLKEKNELMFDLKVPLSELENPFSHNQDKKYVENASNIPLSLLLDGSTHNLQVIRLRLKCLNIPTNQSNGLENRYKPESHLVRKLMDPGYFSVNLKTGKIGIKDFNNLFQITIQDLSLLEEKQLIRQKYLSNIEIISDFDLFFRANDEDLFENVLTFKKNSRQFTVGDETTKKADQPKGALKLMTYNAFKNRLDFTENLNLLSKYWDFEFTSYADIGCCTSETLGETILKITRKSRAQKSNDPMEQKKMLFCKFLLIFRFRIRTNP
jgi:hypothetical protein